MFNFPPRLSDSVILAILVLIVVLLSILDVLPYLCGFLFHYDEPNNRLSRSLQASEYINSMVLVMGLAIPLLLDILIDIRLIKFPLLVPRILIACSCLLTHAIFYFSEPSITLFIGLYRARIYSIAGALAIFLFQTHHSGKEKLVGSLIVLTGFCYNLFVTCADIRPSLAMNAFRLTFRFLLGSEILAVCLWNIYRVGHEPREVLSSTSRKLTLIYTIILAIFYFGKFVIWFSFGAKPWEHITVKELICYNTLEALTMLGAIVLPARLARFETHENEVRHLACLLTLPCPALPCLSLFSLSLISPTPPVCPSACAC
jgi:hypothetical protein